MATSVPEKIRALALTRPHVIRADRDAATEALRQLGVDLSSQIALFFIEFCAVNLYSTSSKEELRDPSRPTAQMARVTRFVRDAWELPDEYICLTSCEGEGCYLYSNRTGAVYDFALKNRLQFLAEPAAKWKDFNTFIEWFLTPPERCES